MSISLNSNIAMSKEHFQCAQLSRACSSELFARKAELVSRSCSYLHRLDIDLQIVWKDRERSRASFAARLLLRDHRVISESVW